MNRKSILVTAGLAATLALAGCSGGGGKTEAFDFTGGGSDGFYDHLDRASSIKVELPEGLLSAAGPEADSLLFTTATVSAVELDSSQFCAFEVTPDFKDAEAAVDSLTRVDFDEETAMAFAEQSAQELLDSEVRSPFGDVSGTEDLLQKLNSRGTPQDNPDLYIAVIDGLSQVRGTDLKDRFDALEAVTGEACIAQKDAVECTPWGSGSYENHYNALGKSAFQAALLASGMVPATWDEAIGSSLEDAYNLQLESAIARMVQSPLEHLESVPEPERAAERLGMPTENAAMISDLDSSAPEEGTYFADDFLTATIVQGCAMSPSDVNGAQGFAFNLPVIQEPTQYTNPGGETSWEPLASLNFTPMADGTLGIGTAGVYGFVMDSNGTWIKRQD